MEYGTEYMCSHQERNIVATAKTGAGAPLQNCAITKTINMYIVYCTFNNEHLDYTAT